MKLVVNTMCLGPLAMLGLTLYEGARLPGMRPNHIIPASETASFNAKK